MASVYCITLMAKACEHDYSEEVGHGSHARCIFLKCFMWTDKLQYQISTDGAWRGLLNIWIVLETSFKVVAMVVITISLGWLVCSYHICDWVARTSS